MALRPTPATATAAGTAAGAPAHDDSDAALCRSCGACCAYSREWPRFTTEADAEIDRIPHALIDADQSGLTCQGERCAALTGEVGVATACSIYAVRPHVCRACVPGDDACLMARARFGL